jgi:hypothetical protein
MGQEFASLQRSDILIENTQDMICLFAPEEQYINRKTP